MMNMKLAVLAVAGLAIAPVTAFAQSAPAPINQTGPGVTAPVSSSTDLGIAGQSGNTHPTSGGIYTTVPRAAALGSGYRSYAAVPGSGYYAASGYGGYAAYGAPSVTYGYAEGGY